MNDLAPLRRHCKLHADGREHLRRPGPRGKYDRNTRHDGVVVDCESRTLETRRFLNADRDAMRQGWEAWKEREWNAVYCNDEPWREAIENGWKIISALTFRTGEQVLFVAEC
jgi:hypothetical protein